jgi:hypothetical protein
MEVMRGGCGLLAPDWRGVREKTKRLRVVVTFDARYVTMAHIAVDQL